LKSKYNWAMGNVVAKQNGGDSPSSVGKKKFSKPKGREESKNAKLVEENWCKAMNRRDYNAIRRLSTSDSICMYKGAESGMPLSGFLNEVLNLLDSFPDNKMKWDSVQEVAPGVVVVKNFVGRGTHTGKPFGFGPFPKIPATYKVVEEDPCHLTIKIKNGKMSRFIIDTYCGDLVGPPGYYQKIGGNMAVVPAQQ